MRNDWNDVLGWDESSLSDIRAVGYAYIQQGCYKTALAFFEPLTMISESPYDTQTLGALYLQVGDYLTALNHLEKALQEEPMHGPTLLNRAKALFRLGYAKQGLVQAKSLEANENPRIASHASALVLTNS